MFKVIRSKGVAAALALLLAVAGCGGGGDSNADPAAAAGPQAVVLDTARSVGRTLGAAGGSISATAADGRRYTLQVPPGALSADTDITATPVTSMGSAPLAAGVKAAVRFGPAGLTFAVPALLRIEGAATTANAAGSDKRLVGFVRADNGARMSLQLPAQAAAALELQVPHFSDVGVSEASLAELALVPIVTPASVADEIFDIATRELPPPASGAQALATVFAALHDRIVLRELDDATRAETPEARLVAATAFGIWDRAIQLGTADAAQYAAVVALLGDRYVLSRARAGGFVKLDLDAGLAACEAPAPIGTTKLDGLKSALSLQVFAQHRGLDAVDLGLDGASVARRANACARVAFVPKVVPAFSVGTPVSLDTQAEVIFAADANFRAAQPLAFSVGSSAASVAMPDGVGDVQGRYTTVVTPSAAAPLFDVKACLMVVVPVPVQHIPEGELLASVLCGTQQVGANAEVILAGRLTLTSDQVNGTADLRVRMDADNRFTVLAVSGSWTQVFGLDFFCATNTLSPRQVSLRSTERGQVTAAVFEPPRVNRPLGSFELVGPSETTSAVLVDPSSSCETVNSTRITEDGTFGEAAIQRIERDAAGAVTAVLIGGRTGVITGRLERQ